MRIRGLLTACAVAILAGTDVYGQTDTAAERTSIGRWSAQLALTTWRPSNDVSVNAPASAELRRWQVRAAEARNHERFAPEANRVTASNPKSRKKAMLTGATIGGGVGAGGGAYAVYATGGDAEAWLVPAFAGLGVAVGAACGWLISLF